MIGEPLRLTPIHRNVDHNLQKPGPFTVYIQAWHSGKSVPYSTGEPHYVSWRGMWISDEAFPNYNSMMEALEAFTQGRR